MKFASFVGSLALAINGILGLLIVAYPSADGQPQSPRQGAVAFVDVNVVPMDSNRILPHRTVITGDGRIVAIGAAKSVRIPKDALRIDGKDRFLLPGFADMHVHLNIRGAAGLLKNEDYAALFLANGVTTVRNMWGNADILAFRQSIENDSSEKIVGGFRLGQFGK